MNIDIFKNILNSLYKEDKKDSSVIAMMVYDYFNYDICKKIINGVSYYFNVCDGEIIDLADSNILYSGYEIVAREDLSSDSKLNDSFIDHMKNNFYMIPIESTKYLPKFRYAVITILKDSKGRYILQRRGKKARDEAGRLEEIGGAFEDSDKSLEAAMERELREEVGLSANIKVDNVVGKFLNTKYDLRTGKVLSWLFVLYESFYLGGELKIAEPEKCEGYEFYYYDELPWDEMSESSKVFNKYYKNVRGE